MPTQSLRIAPLARIVVAGRPGGHGPCQVAPPWRLVVQSRLSLFFRGASAPPQRGRIAQQRDTATPYDHQYSWLCLLRAVFYLLCALARPLAPVTPSLYASHPLSKSRSFMTMGEHVAHHPLPWVWFPSGHRPSTRGEAAASRMERESPALSSAH